MKYFGFILLLICSVGSFAQNNVSGIADGVDVSIDLFNASENDDISCYRIPALVTAPNGDILAAIDERVPSCGDLKWSRDINIVLRRSSDHGSSWSEIETIADFPDGQSASDPSMIVDEITGEVFLFYNYMDLDKEKDVYYLHVIKSKDNGRSWSDPEDITRQISLAEWHKDFKFITSGRGIQTTTGKLLHCMVNLDNGMHLFGSDDHGKSWYLFETAIRPANESKIVELSDGTWMINSRTNGTGLRYIHTSADEGISWSTHPDSALIDPSCNASIIRHSFGKGKKKKDILLFANAKSNKGRVNMTVRYSEDDGASWSDGKTIYKGGTAYSTLTVLNNGNIGLLFEKDGYKENPFISFSLKWLME